MKALFAAIRSSNLSEVRRRIEADPTLVRCTARKVHAEDGTIAKTGTIDVTVQIKAP